MKELELTKALVKNMAEINALIPYDKSGELWGLINERIGLVMEKSGEQFIRKCKGL